MKIGDIHYIDSFGEKLPYKVIKVNEDGTTVSELVVGVISSPTVEDLVEEIKEANEAKEEKVEVVEKKETVKEVKVVAKKPTAKKPTKKK